VIDLKAIHCGMLGNDRLEQQSQRRNVPLAFPKRKEQPPPRVFRIDLEGLIKGSAGRQHPELIVEHQERLWNGVDDRLRERLRLFDILEIEHGVKVSPIWSARSAGGAEHSIRYRTYTFWRRKYHVNRRVGVAGPDGIDCARMRSLQISDKEDRPWNRLAELTCTHRSLFSRLMG
jgi:hypothetical protein